MLHLRIAAPSHLSAEIVDILAAAGITTPDISILSDEFLAEVQQMDKPNLALEALRKLLNDQVRSPLRVATNGPLLLLPFFPWGHGVPDLRSTTLTR